MRNLALPFGVAIEQRIHHDRAACVRKQLAAQPDQAAAGYAEFNPHAPIAVIVHIGDFALARAQLLHHNADELFRNVHRQMFHRLHQLAVDPLGHDFRLADHQLVTFAPHHLDQDGKLQFSASQNFE